VNNRFFRNSFTVDYATKLEIMKLDFKQWAEDPEYWCKTFVLPSFM